MGRCPYHKYPALNQSLETRWDTSIMTKDFQIKFYATVFAITTVHTTWQALLITIIQINLTGWRHFPHSQEFGWTSAPEECTGYCSQGLSLVIKGTKYYTMHIILLVCIFRPAHPEFFSLEIFSYGDNWRTIINISRSLT
jgi:hypothetical protein